MDDKIEILEHALKIIREILVIIVLIGIIFMGYGTISAVADLQNQLNSSSWETTETIP